MDDLASASIGIPAPVAAAQYTKLLGGVKPPLPVPSGRIVPPVPPIPFAMTLGRPKVDDSGSFDLYSFATSTNTWTVYDKNGTEYLWIGRAGRTTPAQPRHTTRTGLVATSTDANGNATTFVYEANNMYPATTTNALSQSSGYTYDYSNGKVERTTDPNGLVFKTAYDGLGRITTVTQPDFFVRYVYNKDENQIYPYQIIYTGNGVPTLIIRYYKIR